MEGDPRRNDLRRVRRERFFRIGAVCVLCGEDDLSALCFHHPVGAGNDPDLEAPHCHNCHAKHHEAIRAVGVVLSRDRRTPLERIEEALRCLAEWFRLLADQLHAWAIWLRNLIDGLDQRYPQWRQMPEARS